MNKEFKIGYQPNIDNITNVSKYVVLNMSFVKYYAPAFFIILLFFNLSNVLFTEQSINKESMIKLGLILIIWIFIYFRIINSMKKNFVANNKNNEFQTITFTKKSYIPEGQTFKVENFWDETFKIKETKCWFLIYQKKNTAFPIIKADLEDNQYNELKELFGSLNIKKSLK